MQRTMGRIGFGLALLLLSTAARAQGLADDRDAPKDKPKADEKAEELVAPALEKFVDADYPAEAEQQALEGNVVLVLDIDASGHVTNASVSQSAGHGFDEAAVAAAKQFTFKPATRGGKPIAARILYKYAFTLKGAPEEVEEAATTGVLRGTVRVGADGAIDNATILVTDASRKIVSTKTKADGTWEVKDLAPGNYTVSVQAEGYDVFKANEDVVANQSTEVVYRLKPKSDGVAEVVVRGEPPPREVTRRELSRRELSRIPGTNGDALKAIQSLPGVARAPGLSGLLIVRGSAPADTQIFVDGTPVPIVYHFGSFSSVVPTEAIEKLNFYPGNFGAQYGRAMGGIVDVKLREQNTDGKLHGMAQVDLIDARVMANGPLPFAKNWTFFVAGRRSWIDAWIGPVLDKAAGGSTSITSAPVYYDYQAFLETKPTASSRFRIGYFGSDDKLKVFLKGPVEGEPAIAGDLGLHTGFGRFQALYENQISDAVRVRANVAYGYDATNLNAGSLKLNIDTNPLTSRGEVSVKATDWLTVNVGEDVNYTHAKVEVHAPPPPRPGEASPGPINTQGLMVQDSSRDIFRPGMYGELELTPTERLRLVAGGRADYSDDTQKWDPSIRTSARYTIVNEFPKTIAKAGWGTFYQPPQPQETDSVFGSAGLRSNKATHYSVGAEQEITRHVDLSIEGYYKDLTSLVTRLPTAQGNEYFNTGSGYVAGMELLLRYKADEHFFGWIAYTLSRSERRDTDDKGLTLFQYDQPHILTALGSYKLGKGWEIGARFRYVSGSLYTPCTGIGGFYDSASGSYSCISGTAFSQRLSAFHQLDVRVDKTWEFRAWKLSAYLDLYNVYNHQSPDDVSHNFNFSREVEQKGLPIIPSLGLRAEF